ncbi:hypothetical protein QIS74_03381 [Colletotrichum tabaci]|uniref:Uncharacterized protein n=1 Tax=Colletotrichum tabaci TaxID=1209068 RepID=A0AAV9TNN4_9PEZI
MFPLRSDEFRPSVTSTAAKENDLTCWSVKERGKGTKLGRHFFGGTAPPPRFLLDAEADPAADPACCIGPVVTGGPNALPALFCPAPAPALFPPAQRGLDRTKLPKSVVSYPLRPILSSGSGPWLGARHAPSFLFFFSI